MPSGAGHLNDEPTIDSNGRRILAEADTLVDAVHAREIRWHEAQRQEPEHVPTQASIVARVSDDDDQIRRDRGVRHNAAYGALQRSKTFR